MFKDVIFNAKGVVRRFILNCDVPITVYFVLLTVNRLARLVPILVKKKIKNSLLSGWEFEFNFPLTIRLADSWLTLVTVVFHFGLTTEIGDLISTLFIVSPV